MQNLKEILYNKREMIYYMYRSTKYLIMLSEGMGYVIKKE